MKLMLCGLICFFILRLFLREIIFSKGLSGWMILLIVVVRILLMMFWIGECILVWDNWFLWLWICFVIWCNLIRIFEYFCDCVVLNLVFVVDRWFLILIVVCLVWMSLICGMVDCFVIGCSMLIFCVCKLMVFCRFCIVVWNFVWCVWKSWILEVVCLGVKCISFLLGMKFIKKFFFVWSFVRCSVRV